MRFQTKYDTNGNEAYQKVTVRIYDVNGEDTGYAFKVNAKTRQQAEDKTAEIWRGYGEQPDLYQYEIEA
jgi:hypothetical protein